MKKFALIFASLLLFIGTSYGQSKLIKSHEPIEGSYIVVLNDGYTTSDVPLWQGLKGGAHKYKTINGFSTRLSQAEVRALEKDPSVKYIEENTAVHIQGTESNPPTGLDRIDQRNLPLDSLYNYNYTGSGVKIYIMDTGINFTHVDFGGRAVLGTDNIGDGQNGNDCNGHGTHVAGIAGGTQYGVAKGATLVAVRVFDCSANGSIANIAAGMDWITAHKDSPAVVNMSFSFAGTSPTFETSMANAIAKGIVLVSASGNGGFYSCGSSPPSSPYVTLSAGATDPPSDQIWLGSNYGDCVDILAPGLFIDSDWIGSNTAVHNDGGTSMASPHVAGAVALYLQNAPLDGTAYIKNFITSNATPNVVQGDLRGSPNLLLYSAFTVTPYTVPSCSGQTLDGYISSGQTVYYPSSTGATAGGGTWTGSVFTGNGTTVGLTLETKRGQNWSVAGQGNPISFNNSKSQTYRWSVTDTSGSAGFRLCTTHP